MKLSQWHAPEFAVLHVLTGKKESTFSAKALLGKRGVVVFVYPKDDTPGCTREAQAFQENLHHYKKAGFTVVGVSRDTIAKHQMFANKYALSFPLVSDPDRVLHEALGAWGEKSMYGKKVMGVLRTTAVFDGDGSLTKLFSNVKVDGHVEAVLEFVNLKAASGTVTKKAATAKKTRTLR
jgi:thioredoxin-dependent peroxiredoxin